MELKHLIALLDLALHVSALKIPSHHKTGVYIVSSQGTHKKVAEVTRAKSPNPPKSPSKGSSQPAPKSPSRASAPSAIQKGGSKHARREADPWAFADPDAEAYAEAEAYPEAWAFPEAFADPFADADPEAWLDDAIWGFDSQLLARGGSGYKSDRTGCGDATVTALDYASATDALRQLCSTKPTFGNRAHAYAVSGGAVAFMCNCKFEPVSVRFGYETR